MLADRLKVSGSAREQLQALLDWAEQQLGGKDSRSSNLGNEQLITDAIVTIAKFSENLNNTLVPLTEQLERVVDRLEKQSD